MVDSALRLRSVCKSWRDGDHRRTILDAVSFDLAPGESCAIIGPSGSGKSTLLNLCSGIDSADSGDILAAGFNLSRASESLRADWRLRHCGRVFQFFHLLPTLTLAENVAVPLSLAGEERNALQRAHQSLAELGLASRADAYPDQTSGGEQQRAAIARALIMSPRLVVADEPTGNLDADTAAEISSLLLQQCQRHGASLLLATHASDLAQRTDRCLRLQDARLQSVDSEQP